MENLKTSNSTIKSNLKNFEQHIFQTGPEKFYMCFVLFCKLVAYSSEDTKDG
jgi:hypothetical protein